METIAQALEQQLQTSCMTAMSFEERLVLLVDREVHARQDRRCARLLKLTRLKYPQAAIEDLDSRTRGIERSAVMSLALDEWVTQGHAVLITGPTGAGKSWLACALAQYAVDAARAPISSVCPAWERSCACDKPMERSHVVGWRR
jgi:DNA replication protein DnaC